MRKLKALGRTLVAIGAISAVAAASASAGYNIKSATGGTFSGSQVTQNSWTTDVGTIKCTTTSLSATQASETAERLTVTPTYTGCTLAGVKVNVTMNGCDYSLGFPEATTKNLDLDAFVDIWCSGFTPYILVKDTSGLGCEVKFGEQTTGGKVTFNNELSGTFLATFEVVFISYSWTKTCPNGGKAGSNTNGTYAGSARFEGKNTKGEKVNVDVT